MYAFSRPTKTPLSVKWLIWITSIISLLSPIVTYLLGHYFQIPGPSAWLTLSFLGLKEGWLWQPLTYFFLQTPGITLNLSLLFSLFFHMLLVWFTGSEISNRFKQKGFVFLYLSSGLIAGLISTAALFLFKSQATLYGSTPCVLSLLIIWAMLYPEMQFSFLLLVRIKAKTLVAIVLGLALLMNLSNGEWIHLLANISGILWGFLIGRFAWSLPNPYPLNLEFPKKKSKKEEKIIDISVFQENDSEFMDRMLDKISEHGSSALTKREKERMDKISKSKNHSNK